MAATLDRFFGKKDDPRVPYGRGKKPDSEKSVDVRSEERLMSKSPLPEENKLKAVKLCTGDGMKDLENPSFTSLREQLPETAHIYEFSEIRAATNNFVAKKFSSSSSSASWRCVLRGNDVVVFQRKFRRQINAEELRERLSLIGKSHHSSLIKLRGASVSGSFIYLVYDYVHGANLAECIRNPRNPNFTVLSNWMSRIQIATDIAHGLDYIHHSTGLNSNFIHNHMKSTSIIVSEPSLNAKICHLGTAELCGEIDREEEGSRSPGYRRSHSRLTKFEDTRGYMAPEFQANGILTAKTDVFAFGVVILELLSGKEPLKYEIDEESGGYRRISLIQMVRAAAVEGGGGRLRWWVDKRLKDSYPVEVAAKLLRVGLRCIEGDPAKRPNMRWVAGRVSKLYLESKTWAETLAMEPENKSIISGVFANSKENKDKDRASVKVYTRRVGQEVFWDTKLQRHRPLVELELDREIRDELSRYRRWLAAKESGRDPKNDWGITGYTGNLRINAQNCWNSMELEHPATFEELGMDLKNKGVISDFFGFVRVNELCKRIGQASKKDNCLVYDSPGTGRSSIIAAMANYLKFDMYHLDLTSFSSLKELQYTLLSTRDRSVIAIEGLYQCAGMLLNLKTDDKYAAKYLMVEIDALFWSHNNERIFVFTTNHRDQDDAASSIKKLRLSKDQSAVLKESFKEHNTLNPKQNLALAKRKVEVWFQNWRARTKLKQTEVDCEFLKHRDQHDAASLRPVGRDIYINTSSPLPTSLLDGGKRTYHNSLLVSNSEKENTREPYDSTKGYSLADFDATENKVVRVYSRRGWDWSHSMELERPPTFTELGKDPENEGIISDLLRFVRDEELYKRIGKHWKRGYLLYDSPGTDRSSLIAAMANYLKFDIYDLDLTGLSSIRELRYLLTRVNKRSLIAIKDFDHWFGMHPNRKNAVKSLRKENELTLSSLFEIIEELVEYCSDQQIIVLTTNHNHRDLYHTALLSPLNIDAYMHTSSPQPIALPDGDGGEIVELDSSKQKPLVDLDATNNRAYQSIVLVSNSEKGNTRETSKRQCMTEGVLSSDDSRTRISLTDFVAPDYRADLVKAYQSGPTMFNSEKKNTRKRLSGECLTKSVLSDDDLTKQELLPERTSLAFSELTSEDIDGFYDSISVDSDSDSDDFDDGAGMLPDLKDEFVDGLSSSYGDERITVSTTNHRDPHDAALLPLVNLDTDIHTASPPPIALPDGGEILPLESSEQESLVDFEATNDKAYQSGVLASSEKIYTIDAYKGRWESLIQRTKKDMGDGLNEECLTKCALILDDSTEQNSVDPRWGRGHLHSTEHEQPAMFTELGTDPENEGIVSDLLRFVREKELYKRVDKAWKRGYLLYDRPCTDRSSLIAYMAKCLEFEIYNLDLTGFSSIEELTNMLVSVNNRFLIVIKDFDHWVGMLPNLKNELTLSGLLEIIHGLLSSCGDERIIILKTNHNNIDRVDAALLHPLNIDLYIHTSSPQPIVVPDGGEIVQLDSSEQMPLEDFDATNNRAYHRYIHVSNSKEKTTREASRRQCMPESVLSLVDSTTRISSTDFDSPNNSAHLVRAYHSGPVVFNSEKKDLGEGLNRECLTKSVLNLDDSSQQKSLPDVDATKKKAHLVRAYQKGLVVSLSENKNRGEALKRVCITKSILGLEDLQQHPGGRLDDAAKNFGAIYVPGIHKTDSLAQKSFKVVETLLTREQPNDCVPLLSIGRLTLEGWQQEKKSSNLPRVLQIKVVEQRVTKLPICLEGLTAESASSSRWPIGLRDGRHVVVLDPLEQSTKSIAHADWGDQCSPTVSLPEKKIVRKTLKKKCRTMSVIFESHQQHFGGRSEGSAKNFRAMRIGRKHGTNRLSIVKLIHKQHGIHQWPFRQIWATRKRYYAGDKRSFEVSGLSMNEKLDSSLQFIQMFQCAKADESGLTVSNSEKQSMREALKRDSLEDLRQHFGARRKDVAKGLCDSLAWKSSEVLDSLSLGKQSYNIRHLARRRTLTHKHCVRLKKSQNLPRSLRSDCSGELATQSALGLPDGGHIPSLPEKKTVRKMLKRKSRTMSVLSLEDHQQHVGRRWEDDAKFLGAKRICRQLAIDSRSTEKRILRQHGTRWCQFKQSAIDLPDGGHILSLSKKRIVRKTLKRKCRNMSLLRSEYHQHVDSKWEGAVKSLGAKHIYRQLVSRAKHVYGQHGFHRWPFQPNWATLKGYFLGDERPVAIISLFMDGKLVSRLQLIHISWLGRFSPRPPALPPGGEIVEPPLALSSSQLPSTSNRAHLGGQDRSGSTTSHSQNERTREQPEGRKRKTKNLTIEDLRSYVGLTRAEAARKFQMSETTFKRQCRRLKIEQWPRLPFGEEILKPPDPPERNTGQIEMVNILGHLPNPIEVWKPPDPHERTTRETEMENEVVGDFHGPNEVLQDCFDGSICLNIENDSTAEILETPTISHYMDMDFIRSATEETEEARGSHERAFQVIIDELTLSTAYPHPNPVVVLQPQVASTHIVSGNMGIPNDQSNSTIPSTMIGSECWSDWSTFLEDPFQEGRVSGSINWTVPTGSYPALSQPMSTIARTMPEIPLTENEDTSSVELKATYGDTIIKFQLPLMFGISELKEEVSKRREFELGSYKIEYKDAEGDWTLIACNDDIRRYLQQLKSFGKQVIELRVRDEVPNTTNSCEFCGSLTRERPWVCMFRCRNNITCLTLVPFLCNETFPCQIPHKLAKLKISLRGCNQLGLSLFWPWFYLNLAGDIYVHKSHSHSFFFLNPLMRGFFVFITSCVHEILGTMGLYIMVLMEELCPKLLLLPARFET